MFLLENNVFVFCIILLLFYYYLLLCHGVLLFKFVLLFVLFFVDPIICCYLSIISYYFCLLFCFLSYYHFNYLSIVFMLFWDIIQVFIVFYYINIWIVQRLFDRDLKLQDHGSRAKFRQTGIWLAKARFGTGWKGLIPDTAVQLDMFRHSDYYSRS